MTSEHFVLAFNRIFIHCMDAKHGNLVGLDIQKDEVRAVYTHHGQILYRRIAFKDIEHLIHK